MPDTQGLPWPEGDPAALREIARTVRAVGRRLVGVGDRMVAAGASTVWVGDAHDRFVEFVAAAVQMLDGTDRHFGGVGGALDALAEEVEAQQAKVLRLADSVRTARAEEAAAATAAEQAERSATAARAAADAMPLDPGLQTTATTAQGEAASAGAAHHRAGIEASETWRFALRSANEAVGAVDDVDARTAQVLDEVPPNPTTVTAPTYAGDPFTAAAMGLIGLVPGTSAYLAGLSGTDGAALGVLMALLGPGGATAGAPNPGFPVKTLEEFEAMTMDERIEWSKAFITATGDARFTGITGVLAWLRDSDQVNGDDPAAFRGSWFSWADAAVLLAYQDGYLRATGRPQPNSGPLATEHPGYEKAVQLWTTYFGQSAQQPALGESPRARNIRLDTFWATAEEAGVVYGEGLVDGLWKRSDARFTRPTQAQWDFIRSIVPTTHAFRQAIIDGQQNHLIDEYTVPAAAKLLDEALPLYILRKYLHAAEEIDARSSAWHDPTNWIDESIANDLRNHAYQLSGQAALLPGEALARLAPAAKEVYEWLTNQENLEQVLLTPQLRLSELPGAPADLEKTLDVMLGVDSAKTKGVSAAYYVAMMIEKGLLPPMPTELPGRPPIVPPEAGGPVRLESEQGSPSGPNPSNSSTSPDTYGPPSPPVTSPPPAPQTAPEPSPTPAPMPVSAAAPSAKPTTNGEKR